LSARLKREPRAAPVEMGELRPDAPGQGKAAAFQVSRHGGGNVGFGGNLLGRALHRLGPGAEAGDEIRADRRERPARMGAQIRLDRLQLGLRGRVSAAALRLADARENPVSRTHSSAFTMSSTTFLASPNTIMVLSM